MECRDLTLAYEGKPVVDKLSFSLKEGDYLCIVGENGAGKSTLVKGLAGLLKPRSGSIDFGGFGHIDIGYLPQQNAIQRDFPASVYEVVLSGCLNSIGKRLFYGKKEKSLCEKNMERLNISGLKGRCYADLSGGQQRRVLLARALCSAERLLLLDEPAAGLDPIVTGELYSIIDGLNAEGMAVIMVSHDIGEAVARSKHILHLGSGSSFFGTVEEYRKSPVYREFAGGCNAGSN